MLPGVDIRVLHDSGSESSESSSGPSRRNIFLAFAWLLEGLVPGESVYVHYSGHGGVTVDLSGDERTGLDSSGLDSCIFPISESGQIERIIDDELRSTLAARVPSRCKLTAVFDCCNSGTCLDLRYSLAGARALTIVTQNRAYRRTDGDVLFLSACTDAQMAAETVTAAGVPVGALTAAFLATIAGTPHSCGRAAPFDITIL
jgi:hypothetical protein